MARVHGRASITWLITDGLPGLRPEVEAEDPAQPDQILLPERLIEPERLADVVEIAAEPEGDVGGDVARNQQLGHEKRGRQEHHQAKDPGQHPAHHIPAEHR